MKKSILSTTALLLSFWLYSPCAEAQINFDVSQLQNQARNISDNEFKAMDKNKDGAISKKEYLDYVMEEARKKNEAAFAAIDQNKDGKISQAEYEDFMNFATRKMNDFFSTLKQPR